MTSPSFSSATRRPRVSTLLAAAVLGLVAIAAQAAPEGKPAMNPTYDSASYTNRYQPERTIYQDDGRIFHRAGFTYAVVTRLADPRCEDGVFSATAKLSDGTESVFRVINVGGSTLRLQLGAPGARFADESPMLVHRVQPEAGLTMKIDGPRAELALDGYQIRIGLDPFSFAIREPSGRQIMELETEQVAGDFVTAPLGFRRAGQTTEPFISWRIHNSDRFFGLGEKFNKVEKTSTRATIWSSDTAGTNTTDLSYKSIPLLHCTAGWSLMLHTTYRSFWEVGTFSYTDGSCLSQDDRLDAFLFLAPTLKGLIGRYSELTGRTAVPPLWAFGVWMSRCAYTSRAQVETVLNRLRAEQIPCDVVHLDPNWMRNHYYFKLGVDACDFERDEEAFPDLRGALAHWREMGFATCFWINPYLPEGHPIYEEAKTKGYLLRSVRGGIARLEYGEPVGAIDFTNPAAKAWWQGKLKELIADGAAVFKPDYGDRVSEDSIAFDGKTGRELHNLYLHLYAQTVAEAVQEGAGYTLVWRRAGYIGTQRYPGTWAGDTQVTWEGMRGALRGGLSAGFGAEACWSHDIGGFVGEKPAEELYIRWAQWGLLSPFARFHGTSPREPWEYGPRALEIVRHYAQLRYTLVPYLRQCVEESARTGLPILRHLALEFPDDPAVTGIDDEYLLGPSILVAPVLENGARDRLVYVPEGAWCSLENPAEQYAGGRYYRIPAPLERIPVLVRRGATLPRFATAPMHLKGELPPVINWVAP
jgi:alpha-D-xyloside xylohydrolase